MIEGRDQTAGSRLVKRKPRPDSLSPAKLLAKLLAKPDPELVERSIRPGLLARAKSRSEINLHTRRKDANSLPGHARQPGDSQFPESRQSEERRDPGVGH